MGQDKAHGRIRARVASLSSAGRLQYCRVLRSWPLYDGGDGHYLKNSFTVMLYSPTLLVSRLRYGFFRACVLMPSIVPAAESALLGGGGTDTPFLWGGVLIAAFPVSRRPFQSLYFSGQGPWPWY